MTTIDLASAVKAGAALLDDILPGWEQSVNPDTLDIHREHLCILGQLFGSFPEGCHVLSELGISQRRLTWVCEYGFSALDTSDEILLGGMWKMVLAARLGNSIKVLP